MKLCENFNFCFVSIATLLVFLWLQRAASTSLRVLLWDASDDALDFGVVLQSVLAVLATVTRHFESTEWSLR